MDITRDTPKQRTEAVSSGLGATSYTGYTQSRNDAI